MGKRTLKLVLAEEIGKGAHKASVLSEVSKEISDDEIKRVLFGKPFDLIRESTILAKSLDKQIEQSR